MGMLEGTECSPSKISVVFLLMIYRPSPAAVLPRLVTHSWRWWVLFDSRAISLAKSMSDSFHQVCHSIPLLLVVSFRSQSIAMVKREREYNLDLNELLKPVTVTIIHPYTAARTFIDKFYCIEYFFWQPIGVEYLPQ